MCFNLIHNMIHVRNYNWFIIIEITFSNRFTKTFKAVTFILTFICMQRVGLNCSTEIGHGFFLEPLLPIINISERVICLDYGSYYSIDFVHKFIY